MVTAGNKKMVKSAISALIIGVGALIFAQFAAAVFCDGGVCEDESSGVKLCCSEEYISTGNCVEASCSILDETPKTVFEIGGAIFLVVAALNLYFGCRTASSASSSSPSRTGAGGTLRQPLVQKSSASSWPQYTGARRNGKYHGHGTLTFESGTSYIGMFSNGKKHGHGVEHYSNGNRYDGQWNNGQYQGTGTFHRAAGTKLSGQWSAGSFVNGKVEYHDGRCYQGPGAKNKAWSPANQPHGEGVMTFPDGSVFRGAFDGSAHGRPHGIGTMSKPDGTTEYGMWQQGRLIGLLTPV